MNLLIEALDRVCSQGVWRLRRLRTSNHIPSTAAQDGKGTSNRFSSRPFCAVRLSLSTRWSMARADRRRASGTIALAFNRDAAEAYIIVEEHVQKVGARGRARFLGHVPVPLSATLCGLPPPLSASDRAAIRGPVAVGMNRTVIVQLLPAPTAVPQLLLWEKSPKSAPAMLIDVIANAVVPTFVSVTVFGGLTVPTPCVPKSRWFGNRFTTVPVPPASPAAGCPPRCR